MSQIPKVVVVGGGFAGLDLYERLAHKLDGSPSKPYELTLVTARPYFVHLPAAIRMTVTSTGHFEKRALVQLTDLPKFNKPGRKLVVGSVASIVEDNADSEKSTGGHLVLENGDKVEYSILILATGSSWEGTPFGFNHSNIEESSQVVYALREKYKTAQDIVVVGGGAIGFETAGEIKDQWPTKNVTIVHGGSHVMNEAYPLYWRERATKKLTDKGVKLVLGDYLDNFEIDGGKVRTRNGVSIPADYVVAARGSGRPNTKYVRTAFGDKSVSDKGFVKISPTFQLQGRPRIFAMGDIIDWNEQKQYFKASRGHVPIVFANVLVLLGLGTQLKRYKGSPEMLILTNGKSGGIGYLGILWGITVGDWIATFIKSKKLILEPTLKAFVLPDRKL